MTTAKLRFGICGLGYMGRTYYGHLSGHPHAAVVAICDREPEARAGRWSRPTGNVQPQQAARPDLRGIAAYATPAELIADPNVDVVAVTLPTPLHADVAVAALTAGKHVLCEKPMARDLAGAERMVAAAERSGRTLMTAQCIRFWPQYECIRGLVDSGRLGAVRFAKLLRVCSPPEYSAGSWVLDGRQSGGALLDLHVHDVDFALHLLGRPDVIAARGRRGPSGEVDQVFATWTYADGRLVQLEGGWLYHKPRPFEMAITVCGERAAAEWSSLLGTDVLLYAGGMEPERLACGDQTGWPRELDYFIQCVRTGQPVGRCLPASTRDGLALALRERDAVLESA